MAALRHFELKTDFLIAFRIRRAHICQHAKFRRNW